MPVEIAGDQLIQDREVALVPDLLPVPADEGFVVFGGHG